jgi:glycosyltransferase involved in cell wall biosynthesis
VSARILLATHGSPDRHTGVYRHIATRAEQLTGLGHSVDIVTSSDLSRVRLRRIDWLLLPLAVARRVASYDLVVFHSYLGWFFHATRRWYDPAGRVATVTAFHGLEPLYFQAVAAELARTGERFTWRFRLFQRLLLPLLASTCHASDAVLCLNAAERAYIVGHRWADPDRTFVVANPFDPALLRPRGHRPHATRLLFLGQWLRAKGTRALVEAFARVAATRDACLACIGTGAPADVVLRAFPAAVRPFVSVQPTVDQEQIAAAFREADLFVFPSLSEGSSAALLEAMASGLPIVTTAVGAAPDMLKDGESVLFVPPADAAALAGAILRALDDGGLRARLGESAQRTAMDLLSAEAEGRYVQCLTRVLASRTNARASAVGPEHASR